MSSKVSTAISAAAMSVFATVPTAPVLAGWVGIAEPTSPYRQPLWGPGGKTGAAFMSGIWNGECTGNNSALTGKYLSIYNHNAAWITAQCWYIPCPPGTKRGSGGGCFRLPGPIHF